MWSPRFCVSNTLLSCAGVPNAPHHRPQALQQINSIWKRVGLYLSPELPKLFDEMCCRLKPFLFAATRLFYSPSQFKFKFSTDIFIFASFSSNAQQTFYCFFRVSLALPVQRIYFNGKILNYICYIWVSIIFFFYKTKINLNIFRSH